MSSSGRLWLRARLFVAVYTHYQYLLYTHKYVYTRRLLSRTIRLYLDTRQSMGLVRKPDGRAVSNE